MLGPILHPYGIPGRFRRVAYVLVLGLSIGLAFVAAWVDVWFILPTFAVAFLAMFTLHERRAWRWWSRWHGIPDLSGNWLHASQEIMIRQTWTRLAASVREGDECWQSRMASWNDQYVGGSSSLTILLANDAGRHRVLTVTVRGNDRLEVSTWDDKADSTRSEPPRVYCRQQ